MYSQDIQGVSKVCQLCYIVLPLEIKHKNLAHWCNTKTTQILLNYKFFATQGNFAERKSSRRAQFELSYHIEGLFFYKNKMLEIKRFTLQ